jgi:CRISPR-associated protein Csm1
MKDDEDHAGYTYKKARLHSIFEYLQISDGNKIKAAQRYELDRLDSGAENLFPSRMENLSPPDGKPIVANYADLWADFIQELQSLKTSDPEQFIAPLLSLLEKYTWCIPSSTVDRPDISLYDHARTTAAIAAALYRWQQEGNNAAILSTTSDQQPFMLVSGDLSGIQSYLFNIKNVGVGGAAKRLRARSFMISALVEAASHILLKEFGMPLTNLIISSGGKFYLLLPALQDAEKRIDEQRTRLNEWLLDHRNGELTLNLAAVRFSCREFQAFNTVLKRVNDALQQEKSRQFHGVLTNANGWDENRFIVQHVPFTNDESLCQACGHFPGARQEEEGAVICGYCADDAKLGRELANAAAISFMPDTGGSYPLFDHSFSVHKKGQTPRANAYLVALLNDWNLAGCSGPVRSRYVANHIPSFDDDTCRYCTAQECKEKPNAVPGQPKFFRCMAEASRGRKVLGVLKADVDYLGLIFINGFLSDKEKSISRIATLSRMLDGFFTGRIDALLRDEFTDLYTVYAGGDDLLLLGPWSMMLKFAHRLREEFSQYTCGNPDFTLSAGMALAKPGLPVLNIVQQADDLLDQAKNEAAPGKQPKNQLATLGDCFKWDKAERLQLEADRLAGWYEEQRVSTGFVRQLLDSSRQFKAFILTAETRHLRFVPMLAYAIARNIPTKEHEIVKWAQGLTDLNDTKLSGLSYIANYSINMNRS